MKRYKAFTITEVVVVLILSTVSIGIIMSAFGIVKNMHQNNETDLLLTWKTGEFYSFLKRDIFLCGNITCHEKQVVCHFMSYNIVYEFYNNEIVRWISLNPDIRERYPFQISLFRPTFVSNTNDSDRVQEIQLLLVIDRDTFPMQFHKYYNAKPVIVPPDEN